MVRKILQAMSDNESKFLFEKNIESIILNDPIVYREAILETEHHWELDKSDDLSIITSTSKPIYIFGAGYFGKLAYLLLRKLGLQHRVVAYIDNDEKKYGKKLYGLDIINFFNIDIDVLSEAIFLISANRNHASEIYNQLMRVYTIPLRHIVFPRAGYIRGRTGQQYFDVFRPNAHEIFVDAGASYGDSSLHFVEWTQGNYDNIFAFDPRKNANKYYNRVIEENHIDKARFFAKGLWSVNGTLHFHENASASRIDDSGVIAIPVVALDSVLGNENISFIKMDIEGAELEALKGSVGIIKKYRPRLAISIYHKQEDIISIPSYILDLNAGYKFIIRPYCTNGSETILYAYPV